MRIFVAVSLLVAGLTGAASAAPDTPLASGNVSLVGNIPELGAVGGHVRKVDTPSGEKQYFMMSGASGVSAYDISIPEAPVLAGRLPLPNWSNEDVEVGGGLMLVSVDPQWVDWATPSGTIGGLYILDISQLPLISFAYLNPATGNRWTPPSNNRAGHTVSCVRVDCSFAILNGVDEVVVVDLRTPSAPRVVKRFQSIVGDTHDAQMDDAGIVWISGADGVAGYDFRTPSSPKVVVPPFAGGLDYQHNSFRPDADTWTPGGSGTTVRNGELVMVTEESLFPLNSLSPTCDSQGRFQTRRVRDADAIGTGAAATTTVLDTWSTEKNLVVASSGPSCSAHYFSEREDLVAIGWYQHGVRFLDVSDPRDIRQVGYYINPSTWVFGAEWIGPGATGGEILYTLDPARGLDILKFDRAASMPTVRPPAYSVVSRALPATEHPTWGYACRLGA